MPPNRFSCSFGYSRKICSVDNLGAMSRRRVHHLLIGVRDISTRQNREYRTVDMTEFSTNAPCLDLGWRFK
jgi:hypothetical protein